MKHQVKPTTKNSPAIHKPTKVFNGSAEEYAPPHTMKDKPVHLEDAGVEPSFNKKKNWVPLKGVSITMNEEVKETGIKIRGTGAAERGVMARGPMA
jgi:hypothetical protein